MTEICNECLGSGCPRCDGFGRLLQVIEQVRCGLCVGTGRVNMMENDGRFGKLSFEDEFWVDCLNCDGTGIVQLVIERQLVSDRELLFRVVAGAVIGILSFHLLLPMTGIGLIGTINFYGILISKLSMQADTFPLFPVGLPVAILAGFLGYRSRNYGLGAALMGGLISGATMTLIVTLMQIVTSV